MLLLVAATLAASVATAQQPTPPAGTAAADSGTTPQQVFMVSQEMFAITKTALSSGAFAERKKFSSFLMFTALRATIVYEPLAPWVWGDGGWLNKLGAIHFAGGTVVHIT